MELFMLFIVLFIVFLSTCVAIIVLTDTDILTFLAIQFGRAPADELNGKVIWITGASSGIGEALTKELATYKNVKIVISARREKELERVKRDCITTHSKTSDDILLLPFDMTDISVHQAAFDKVISEFGKLDILVSNAGRSQRALWHKIQLDVDKELFDLNVFSVVNLNRIVVKHYLEVGGGQLVVTSSVAGKLDGPFSASYTASKHAIQGYFGSLRNEVRLNNIHITLLCPGPTFSSLLGPCFTESPGETLNSEMLPNDRRMTAERCAFISWVAIANKIEESWMGVFPMIPFLYINTYMPYVKSKLVVIMAKKNMFSKLRDSREINTNMKSD